MNDEIKLQDLLNIVLKKWWIVAICFFVAAVSAWIYTETCIAEQFTSSGSLYVNSKAFTASELHNEAYVSDANLVDLTTSVKLVDTYKAILSSTTFFKRVDESLRGKTELDYNYAALAGMVQYGSIEETEIIQVYATALNPQDAAAVCAAVLDEAPQAIIDIVEVGSVRTIDEASMPHGPSYPSAAKNTLLGAVLGIVIGLGIVFVLHYMDSTIQDIEDIETQYDMMVLGTIPDMQALKKHVKKEAERT